MQREAHWGTEAEELAEMKEVKAQLEVEEEGKNSHPLVG